MNNPRSDLTPDQERKINTPDTFVAFSASGAGNITNATQEAFDGWSTLFYNYGDAFDATTGIFTAPVTGLYHFECGCQITNTNGRVILWFNQGPGSTLYRSEKQTGSVTADISTEIARDVILPVGTQIRFDAFQETGVAVAPATSFISGYLIKAL